MLKITGKYIPNSQTALMKIKVCCDVTLSVWGCSSRCQVVQEEYVFEVLNPEDRGTVFLRSI